jgi:hypothetical protein
MVVRLSDSPTKIFFTKFCRRIRDNFFCEFTHFSISRCCDPMNCYKIVRTAFTSISVIIATTLILRVFRGIIDDFPVKGHNQWRWIHTFFKGGYKDFEPNFSGFSGNFYNIFQEERGSNQLTPWSAIDIICGHTIKLRIHWVQIVWTTSYGNVHRFI